MRVCQDWGVDPGSLLDDEVLAMNLRAGLSWLLRQDTEPDDHHAAFDATRAFEVPS